jgi:hypothetical protein
MQEQVQVVGHEHIAEDANTFRGRFVHPGIEVVVELDVFDQGKPVPACGGAEVDPSCCSLIAVCGHYPKVKR